MIPSILDMLNVVKKHQRSCGCFCNSCNRYFVCVFLSSLREECAQKDKRPVLYINNVEGTEENEKLVVAIAFRFFIKY